jgi:hypothetical protein
LTAIYGLKRGKMAKSMVYFIQYGENGPIKIGKSEDPETRLLQAQTFCPHECRLLWVYGGNKYSERDLHRKFRSIRIRGEWFECSEVLLSFIHHELTNETDINTPVNKFNITETKEKTTVAVGDIQIDICSGEIVVFVPDNDTVVTRVSGIGSEVECV